MQNEKPHEQSVTGVPCNCGYLQRISADADSPITFDAQLNEYLLRWPDGTPSQGPIYHCPFCGGATPKSRRESLFAIVTTAELLRLRELTSGVKTVEEAIAKFGKPAADRPEGVIIQTPGSEGEPSRATSYRTLIFTRLSDVADVELIDYGVRGIKFAFSGKYMGKP